MISHFTKTQTSINTPRNGINVNFIVCYTDIEEQEVNGGDW